MQAGNASVGGAGGLAAAHSSYTMQLADGQHQEDNDYTPADAIHFSQQTDMTSEQLAAAYAASQGAFVQQTEFDPSTVGHHQMQGGKALSERPVAPDSGSQQCTDRLNACLCYSCISTPLGEKAMGRMMVIVLEEHST